MFIVVGNKQPELFESVEKVAVYILRFGSGGGVASDDYHKETFFNIVLFFKLLICGTENPSCSRAYDRVTEFFCDRESHTVQSRFQRVFAS